MNKTISIKFEKIIKISTLLLLVLCIILRIQSKPFCHTFCQDYTGACFDNTQNGCYVCASNIFKDKDFTDPSNPCLLDQQRKIQFKQLDSTSMSLTGYSSSKSVNKVCGSMSLSGQYVNSDYLQKNFTDINNEHYELIIRFSVGYLGTWSELDNLQLQVNDGVETTYHSWKYSCGFQSIDINGNVDDTENLCSVAGTDCVKIKQFNIQHNSSYVFLKWTALTTETNPNIQSWGIKDLIIVTKTCHRYCDKCFGGNVNQCLTCSPGYFLRGNTCIQRCPKLALVQSKECVETCPTGYYQNSINNICEKCLDDCSLCSGPQKCLLWNNQASRLNSFTEKIQLWIILIIGGVAVLGLLLWKFVLKKYFNKMGSQQTNSNQEPKISQINSNNSADYNELRNTQQNITNHLWIESMDHIQPIKVDVRRRKKRNGDLPPIDKSGEVSV